LNPGLPPALGPFLVKQGIGQQDASKQKGRGEERIRNFLKKLPGNISVMGEKTDEIGKAGLAHKLLNV